MPKPGKPSRAQREAYARGYRNGARDQRRAEREESRRAAEAETSRLVRAHGQLLRELTAPFCRARALRGEP